MSNFLRENWLWIVTPLVLLLIALVVIVMAGGSGEEGNYVYNIF